MQLHFVITFKNVSKIVFNILIKIIQYPIQYPQNVFQTVKTSNSAVLLLSIHGHYQFFAYFREDFSSNQDAT